MGQINFLIILKDLLPKQKKNSCSTYLSFITTYNFRTTGSKLKAEQVPSIFACLPVFAGMQKPCEENFGKFQESGISSIGGSEKDRYFLQNSKMAA